MLNFMNIISQRDSSDRSGKPLRTCSVCEGILSDQDFFTIAKAYASGRLALEAVQCFSCQMTNKDYASEQSLENIMLYSGRRFNQFLQDSVSRKVYHLEDPSCLITGEDLSPGDNFELYTFNVPGAGLAEDNFLFVGPTAMEQMSELLSKETRESWGRFTEKISPDVPDLVVSPMFIG